MYTPRVFLEFLNLISDWEGGGEVIEHVILKWQFQEIFHTLLSKHSTLAPYEQAKTVKCTFSLLRRYLLANKFLYPRISAVHCWTSFFFRLAVSKFSVVYHWHACDRSQRKCLLKNHKNCLWFIKDFFCCDFSRTVLLLQCCIRVYQNVQGLIMEKDGC